MTPTYKLSMCNTYKINLCPFPFVAITYWVCFSLTYTCDWEKAMAPHSSTLAWKIPWTEEPGRLQSMGSLRVGHNWATSLSLFTFMHWRRKWQPTPVFLPGESQDGGAWWAAVYGVAQSQTRLKWLSSSSSIPVISKWPAFENQECSCLYGNNLFTFCSTHQFY